MIITRTPFRISFFGGGTDYPVWYREHGGAVLSTTINKYCYINCRFLPPFFTYKYLMRYIIREETTSIEDIKHPSVRACLTYLNIPKGVEMTYTGDIPAQSGMGSSSSFTVGFLNALYSLSGKMVTKRTLAREALYIEQQVLAENVGAQDQVAAAFGGLNKIEFGGERDFYVTPLPLSREKVDYLQSHLMLFFTGVSRNASEIAAEQIKNTNSKKIELRTMQVMVDEAISILNNGSKDLDDFGKLLNESWRIKRSLTDRITSSRIDAIYDAALKSGALGGKLLGAGGGGFILFFVKPDHQPLLKEKLKDILYVPFGFDALGTQVVMYSTQDFY
ncbi:MAG: kinase [Deltaproteobacteria bacterium]|nr:kinase [Deltaproteobacteria bacterium]